MFPLRPGNRKCPVCLLVLRDAAQTSCGQCGHIFCKESPEEVPKREAFDFQFEEEPLFLAYTRVSLLRASYISKMDRRQRQSRPIPNEGLAAAHRCSRSMGAIPKQNIVRSHHGASRNYGVQHGEIDDSRRAGCRNEVLRGHCRGIDDGATAGRANEVLKGHCDKIDGGGTAGRANEVLRGHCGEIDGGGTAGRANEVLRGHCGEIDGGGTAGCANEVLRGHCGEIDGGGTAGRANEVLRGHCDEIDGGGRAGLSNEALRVHREVDFQLENIVQKLNWHSAERRQDWRRQQSQSAPNEGTTAAHRHSSGMGAIPGENFVRSHHGVSTNREIDGGGRAGLPNLALIGPREVDFLLEDIVQELNWHSAERREDWTQQQQDQSAPNEGTAAAQRHSRGMEAIPGENMVTSHHCVSRNCVDYNGEIDDDGSAGAPNEVLRGHSGEIDGDGRAGLPNEPLRGPLEVDFQLEDIVQELNCHSAERREEETGVGHDEIIHRILRIETKMLEYEGRVCNGTYIWRIENFRQSRQDAVNNVMTAIHSPPFYTGLYGYKMCMRVNLNGVDTGRGRHVSLFVHMMQTDWDSRLKWPFTGLIEVSILDQSDNFMSRHDISKTFQAKPNMLAFEQPTIPRSRHCHGDEKFCSIEELIQPSVRYVRNNKLLICIQVREM